MKIARLPFTLALCACVLGLMLAAGGCQKPPVEKETHHMPADQHDHAHAPLPDSPGLQVIHSFDPPAPQAGAPFALTYRFTNADDSPADLVESHTKLTHLIVVSSDLAYFAHLHPEQVTPAAFAIELNLPTGGDYVLYADATPREGAVHLERIPLRIGGDPAQPVPLELTSREIEVQGYAVHLETDPETLLVGEAMLTFQLMEEGKPLATLEPYLGAMGHLVLISADTTQFLHSHPLDAAAASPGQVAFHTSFPAAGRYKAWLQVQTATGLITAPFVIEVG